MNKYTLISLFSGAGGLDLGFKKAGFDIIWANDFYPEAIETYKKNIGNHIVFGDITKIPSSTIPNNPDVITGGFPCLTGDSLILTNIGSKKLIDIKIGDMVLSHDNNYHKVINFFNQGQKHIYKIKTDFNSIKATANHKFLITKKIKNNNVLEDLPEWLSVEEISNLLKKEYKCYFICPNNDKIMFNTILTKSIEPNIDLDIYEKQNYIYYPIKEIIDLEKEDYVYDIEVETTHSFVVNGCISHNCQGFSVANTKRSMKDERNFLYKELLRVIKDKKPKFFVAENVKGLLSMENGKVIQMIIKDFENLGYKVDYKVLNAAKYGIPQARERVIIIGNRLGLKNPFPEITHYIDFPIEGLKKCPTVKDTIDDLSKIPLSNKEIILPNGSKIYNHDAYTNVKDTYIGRTYEINQEELCDYLRKYRSLRKTSNKKIAEAINEKQTKVDHWFRKDNKSGSIPNKEDYLKLKAFLNLDNTYDKQLLTYEEKEITFEQSLRITNWDRPSDTITATGPEIHINKERRLSVREVARLQTFPDNFIFTGNLDKMYKQVGNAVPVDLANLIAKEIIKELENYNKK